VHLLRRSRDDDAGEPVRVLVHGGPVLEARVTHAVAGAAELRVTGGPQLAPRFLHRTAATIESAEAGRLDVTLLAIEHRGRVRDDALHAVWLPAEPQQRREHARIPAVRPVVLVSDELHHARLRGRTVDLSAGGALVGGVPELRPGDRLRAEIDLTDQAPLQVQVPAIVVREAGPGLRALDWGPLRPGDRDRIARWVRRREIEALRRLRGT